MTAAFVVRLVVIARRYAPALGMLTFLPAAASS
jgi:hypothetical protein